MRHKSPELMDAIKEFVNKYYREHQRMPSTPTIAAAVGVTRNTAYRYLVEMNERGILRYDKSVKSTELTDKCRTAYISAPVVGSIRCGNPESEEEMVEEYVSLPESIFGKGQFYLLRAKGDSMLDAGIAEEDLLVIQLQQEANEGDIVVALDPDGQNTLKRYGGFDEESGFYLLEYMNEKRYPGKVELVKSFVVQGVARHVIKTL
ncbi:MAG: repressor LexA [Lachnospiraceae bacterium]|nr:repressor LexA [Lachnospiraceae bacterium]